MSKHFLARCLATPWAMDVPAAEAFSRVLVRAYMRKDGLPVALSHEGGEHEPATPRAAVSKVAGQQVAGTNIAIVSVMGALVAHASDLGPCEGGMSYDSVRGQLRAAQADNSVGQILMVFDTPGGSVFGCPELAEDIRTSGKPIVGLANYCAASAGYWMLSACSEVYVSPSGQVGSIGVWMAHQDVSGAMEQEGIVTTLISAGKFKVEGNPYQPLGDDARANMQASVDDFYTGFVKAVAKGRGVSVDTVRTGMGQGRMLSAKDALAEKMVDGVMTFDEVVASMQRKARKPVSSAKARAQAEIDIAAL